MDKNMSNNGGNKMNIEEMTIRELREISTLAKKLGGDCKTGKNHSIPVGKNVFIRTVTFYYTGHVERVTDYDIALTSAAWIADTGRFSDALKTGDLSEVEPYPDGEVVIPRDCVIDISRWKHDLPRVQK